MVSATPSGDGALASGVLPASLAEPPADPSGPGVTFDEFPAVQPKTTMKFTRPRRPSQVSRVTFLFRASSDSAVAQIPLTLPSSRLFALFLGLKSPRDR